MTTSVEMAFWVVMAAFVVGLAARLLRKMQDQRAGLDEGLNEGLAESFERHRTPSHSAPSYARERFSREGDDKAA